MSFFKENRSIEGVLDILPMNKEAGIALIHYHTAVMRQESELSVKDRELIAAYVSGLNNCQYCHGVHAVTARSFGVEEATLNALLEAIDSAPIDDRLKPIFHFAKQLTQAPAKTSEDQADAIFNAGWSEQALHDAVNVISLFNFMNRLIEGHGVKGNQALFELRGQKLKDHGYNPILEGLR